MHRIILILIATMLLLANAPLARADEPTTQPSQPARRGILPEVNFDNVALVDALSFLSDASGINLSADWKTLEAAGVPKSTPITLSLHRVSVGKALNEVLKQASGSDPLTFYIDRGVVEITTKSAADQILVTVVYNVRDLVSLDPNFEGASGASSLSLGGGGAAGGGGGGNSSGSMQGGSSQSASGSSPNQIADQLIKLIESTIRPEIWKDNGGNSVIIYFDGRLIVTAPHSVQQAIGGSLQ